MIDSVLFVVNREIESVKLLFLPENRILLGLTVAFWYFAWTKLGLRELACLAWALSKRIVFICLDIFHYFRNKRGRHENC